MRFACVAGLPIALLACSYAFAEVRPTVIELYTAEAAAPAAAEACRNHFGPTNVIALALHVDYWTAAAGSTGTLARRDAAAERICPHVRRSSVVTPEFVIDVRATSKHEAIRNSDAVKETPDGIPIDLSIADAQLRITLGRR